MTKIKNILELERLSIQEFKELDKIPLVLVLEDVRSLNNVGSIFRTSDAFKVSEIICCGITGVPPHSDIHKTALGAENSMKWSYFSEMSFVFSYLKENGYIVCSLEQAFGSIPLQDLDKRLNQDEKYALIVGNEVQGVRQETVDMSDFVLEIPQFGTKHSLNVSIATSLAVWEFYKFFSY